MHESIFLTGPAANARRVLLIRFCLSFCHSIWTYSGSFLGIGPLVFFKTWHGVRGPYGVYAWQNPIFFRKNSLWVKMAKDGWKWPKKGFFNYFEHFLSVFVENICDQNLYINPDTFCTNPYLGKLFFLS